MRPSLRLCLLLLGWAAFRPPTVHAQCNPAGTSVTLDYSKRTAGEDWRNRANAGVPNPTSFTQASTTYTSSDNNSTLVTGTLNGNTLVWTATEPNRTTANSTVTYTFSRPVSNLSVRVRDIDANFVAATGGLFGSASHGFNDEVTFTGANGTGGAIIYPTLTKANTASTFVSISGTNNNVATGSEAAGNTDSPNDGTIIATYGTPVTSITLRYRNVTTATNLDQQGVGIDQIAWCRITPTATTPLTTAPVPSSGPETSITGLSGTADGTPSFFINLPTYGTLSYNSTGTTYVPVLATTALTPAQAASLHYTPDATYTGSSTSFTYRVRDDAGLVSPLATYTIPLQYIAPCTAGTNTFDFTTRPANEDWKQHVAVNAPANSTATTIRSDNYSNSAASSSTLQIGTINAPANTLVWNNQYNSATPGTNRTSSVTFFFNREVSNFTVQVQDIDVNNATGSTFIDQVVFSGFNGTTAVTPTLTAMNPANGSVAISGNTASGQGYNATNGIDGTVTAYFPSPITRLTLTYSNASQGTGANTTQSVGIDNMTWCRLAPTALPVTTTTVPSTATQVGIASLSGSADGTVASYTLTSLPTAGTLFYNSTGTTYVPVTTSTALTPAQAASLRYTPNASFTGTSTSFTYQVRDDAGAVSATPATYTIPLANTACTTATASLNFGTTTPVPDDWRAHAAIPVPAGSTQTSVSTSNYTTPASATTSTLMTVAATANGGGNQSSLNGVQTLVWYTDYANTTDNTSTVTYTFTRPVSNFAVRVQDIDRAEDGTNAFIDQVTFVGANGTTAVTPVLGPASTNNANNVIINGNVATGTTSVTNTTDGTVIAYFASPITSLTLTYRNLSTAQSSQGQGNPSANAVGIDLLSFCRLAPVANPVTIASLSDGTGQTAISPLSSTVDGTVASYRLTTIPTTAQGVLYVNGVAATANQVLTPLQATQLSFDPAVGASNPVTFTYTVTDDANQQSTAATYTIPVNATGAAGPAAPCATPGKDGAGLLTTNPNTYFPSSASQTLAAGATSIAVGAATGTLTNITAGDLLLVIQMQGADINSTNSDSYGDGVAGGGASGNLTTNFTAGTYEYVVASNTITATLGGTLTLANGLRNTYVNAAATTTSGKRTFQVIRVPQYTTLTLGGNLTATPWNGSTGGIIVLDVASLMNFNGFTINASGAGFRGGAGRRLTGSNTVASTDYRYAAATAVGGQKGEGIAGTPQYVNNNGALLDTGADGYPSGSSSRGAPGNAGGGGGDGSPANNAQNSGGGGGANGGAGGRGGNTWSSNLAIGGEPGAAFTVASSSRLILGGGGGAGSTNDGTGTPNNGFASSGSAGGGLVIVRTGSVGTAGSILANGADANMSVTTDGGGGAGAGGSILLTATSPATLANVNLSAVGGKGAITTPAANDFHGGGGGGGGGVIFTDGGTASAAMAGGANGTTVGATGIAFGATPGTAGLSNAQISNSIANSASGANCFADVATTITGPASINAGQPTGNFTATFANIGSSAAQSVSQTITLPAGAGLTTAQRATIQAAYPGTTFSTVGTNPTTINFGTLTSLAPNASNSYSFAYTAPAALGTATTRSSTGTTSLENGQTANNISDFVTTVAAAADVTVALKGPTTLNAGQPTGMFTATFTNEGPNAAANVTRVVTLPAGAMLTATQLTLLQATYPSATYSSATNAIDFGSLTSLASDASSTVSFSFTAPTAVGSSTLTGNTSTSSAEGNNSAPNQTILTLNTVATADIAAAITASSTATTGTFNVTFTNNGPQTAAGVVRTVQLPAGLTGVTFSGDAASYDATTGLVTYSTSPTTIAAGSSLNSTISYALTSNTAPVAATATASTTTNEAGQTANNTATALMPATFDLATTLTGPSTAIAGSPTKLYVTTTNNGPNGAPSATQTVIIPSATPLTNVYITNGGTYTYNTTTGLGTVTFPSVANLPAGQTVTNSISFNAPSSSFAPSAVVDAASGDTDAANNTAYLNANTSSTQVAVAGATTNQTNEATTITADATIVNAGSVVTYTVTATNKGYLNTPSVTKVAEQVQLLPGLTTTTLTVGGVTGTQVDNLLQYTTAAGTTTYDPATGIVTYPVLDMQASGTTVTFDKLAVTVPANAGNNGQLLATATVSTALSDPTPADNTSSVVVKVQTTADLATTLTGTTAATAGQTASYTATFVNQGAGSATNVVETVQLPAGLSNVLVQDASGNVINNAYNIATGLVTIPATPATTNMVAGSSQVYGISFTAPAQSFALTSTISSGTTDNSTTNNSALLRTALSPSADVAVYVSGPATAVAGNAVTYAVTYANNGPNAANAVQATLQLPAGLTGVTTPGGGSYDTNTGLVTFPSVNMAAGDSRVGLINFTMPASPTGNQISGIASVTTTSTDVVASNNTSAITTDVAPATTDQADLQSSVSPTSSSAAAGAAVSYTLTFRNAGPAAAIKVMPTAYLPAGLSNVVVHDGSNNIVANAYNSVTGQIVLPTIDSQASNSAVSYTVDFTAPATSANISASSVSSNTSDPDLTNNVRGSALTVTPVYDVVTSLAGPASAQPGSVNTYTLTTTNNGPSTSSNTANSTTQLVNVPVGSIVGGVPANAYNSSTGVITFPAISGQGSGANGAVSNTFTVQMPATGSLAITATITASGESNSNNNLANLTTAPANQAPVAQNVWNTLQNARGNTAPNGLLISPLQAIDADGSVSSYSVTTLPPATQGVLYLANGSAVVAGVSVPANGLYFVPNPSFIGNATFTYSATDNASATSNRALYTIPVAADQNSAYTTYNSGKGTYAPDEVLAQAVDPNAAIYNGSGAIYSTTGVLQNGANNGLAKAVVASGTLPTGVSLDPVTGRIYVSNPSALPTLTQTTNYALQITTTDANGGTSTVPVTFSLGATPLPVVLVEFTAQAVANRDALLNWRTASEKNSAYFEVERSFDGTSFGAIGRLAAHGTTAAASSYTLTDAGVAAQASGPVYYRLRQVDLDGTATYSPQRTVSFAKVAAVSLGLYPNPVASTTTLDLRQLPATASYQGVLLDATGRQVRSWTLPGGQAQLLDLTNLASGSYLLLVSGTQPDGSLLRHTLRLTKE
jgi:uncharacterized repeat protein (TIGR01451 family)